MKSIRRQLAGEMRKGSIQKVKLPNKESASCLQLQHLTTKSQCKETKISYSDSNISLEDFDTGVVALNLIRFLGQPLTLSSSMHQFIHNTIVT